MAIPDYQSLMKPVLKIVERDGVMSMRDLTERLSVELGFTDEDRRAVIASGMSLAANRTHWAVTYLFKAKAVRRPKRGHVEITQRGRDLLAGGGEIRNATLEQFPEYMEFVEISRRKKPKADHAVSVEAPADESPDDLIARAEVAARAVLAADLLDKVRSVEPVAFERLVLLLLAAMGYGALGRLEHSGQSGDGGIDGIISQDKLGLDRIYIQAKRYAEGNVVQSPAIRDFLGALMTNKGDRGVFLTTSTFSDGAKTAAGTVAARVVLIDGQELVDLMIDHGVGVEPQRVATLHRINEDFFDDL